MHVFGDTAKWWMGTLKGGVSTSNDSSCVLRRHACCRASPAVTARQPPLSCLLQGHLCPTRHAVPLADAAQPEPNAAADWAGAARAHPQERPGRWAGPWVGPAECSLGMQHGHTWHKILGQGAAWACLAQDTRPGCSMGMLGTRCRAARCGAHLQLHGWSLQGYTLHNSTQALSHPRAASPPALLRAAAVPTATRFCLRMSRTGQSPPHAAPSPTPRRHAVQPTTLSFPAPSCGARSRKWAWSAAWPRMPPACRRSTSRWCWHPRRLAAAAARPAARPARQHGRRGSAGASHGLPGGRPQTLALCSLRFHAVALSCRWPAPPHPCSGTPPTLTSLACRAPCFA